MTLHSAIKHFQERQFDQAETACRQVLASQPHQAECLFMLGMILGSRGEIDSGISHVQSAISAGPERADYWLQLALFQRAKGDVDEAIRSFDRAAVLRPADAQIHYASGNLLFKSGQYQLAIEQYQIALRHKPDFANALANLSSAHRHVGQIEQAIDGYQRALKLNPNSVIAHDNLLLTMLYDPATTPRMLRAEASRWHEQHAARFCPEKKTFRNIPDPDRKLKIGYLSPDFCNHPVARFFRPLLVHHNRAKFEIFCYSQTHAADAVTENLRGQADHWCEINRMNDGQVAQKISADEIDILIHLALHTAENRLLVLARKPAPLQAVYLGYAGRCALASIDYRITDRYLDPDETEESLLPQKPVYLRSSYWCYEPLDDTPAVAPLPAIANQFITFGSLNNFSKVSQPTLDLWARILTALPGSRLLLHIPDGPVRGRVLDQFSALGVDCDRVEMVGRTASSGYFQMYRRIDIALDPLPFTGGTTTCDALWMGVPVVTLTGQTPVGRAGMSILMNAGFPEWIANTPERYVEIALRLANDVTQLAEIRTQMRSRLAASPLMDAVNYTKSVETAYSEMWTRWCLSR